MPTNHDDVRTGVPNVALQRGILALIAEESRGLYGKVSGDPAPGPYCNIISTTTLDS